MKQFLSAGDQNKQIVSLGAGFDTTYWKLKVWVHECENIFKYWQKSGVQIQGYYEVDFPEVVNNKISIITKNKTLSDCIQQLTTNDKGMAARLSFDSILFQNYIVQITTWFQLI